MKRRIRLTESDMYAQQWKNELRCFMNGLKSGDYFVDNGTVYVQIWKKKTAQNDPRYVYFRMGDTCLHDDGFSMQDSPRLSSRTLNTINSILGWDDEYMMSESKSRKIRLTESDLHKVIKESVNTILSELDWKTCTSAALERCKRNGYESDLAQKDIQHAVKTAKKQQSKNREEFDQDFKDYFNNKTQYIKGNGWVKESINRVIKESLRKVLNKS